MKKVSKYKRPIACVTGSSSGIGRETAKRLYKAGYTVFGFSRSKSGLPFIHEQTGDVTNPADVSRFVSRVIKSAGRIDLLVNSAGISVSAPAELISERDLRRVLEVNFFGTVAMCRAVLPFMRQNRFGCIINIASVAGIFPLPYEGFYSASKAAVIAFSRALRSEVRGYGIDVVAVAPGGVRTPFTAKRIKYSLGRGADYSGDLRRMTRRMALEEQTGMSAARVACATEKAAGSGGAPVRVVGGIYKFYTLLNRLVPTGITDTIISAKYLNRRFLL